MRAARRTSQIFFLLLFILLFFWASYPYQTKIPVEIFLRLDPLLGITTSLSARKIVGSALLSLFLILLTLVLGRVFCGWICPLGTLIDGMDRLVARRRRNRSDSTLFRLRWLKYAILMAILVAALFSVQLAGFFDPLSLLTRTLTVFLYSFFVLLVEGVFSFFFLFPWIEPVAYRVYTALSGRILPIHPVSFHGAFFVGVMFLGILLLAFFQKRFWCRNLCPLGALFGLFSRFRLFRRHVSDRCTACSLCFRGCRMGAIGDDFVSTDQAECIYCVDCQEICPPGAIRFGFRAPSPTSVDLGRRRLLGAGVAGVITLGLMKVGFRNPMRRDHLVRPPGALIEPAFLDRCIRCGECVRICSTSGAGLQLIGLDGGWEALGTPALMTPMGYCEYHCHLCGQVCPTGAIQPLSLEEKQRMKMGTAHFDKTRCIPWYYGENCMVCEEHCPLPEKAIRFTEQEVTTIDGRKVQVLLPYVDESLCIGCGICTKVCPVVGFRGIFLTNDGERRIPS